MWQKVGHEELWHVMQKFSIEEGLIQVITLYRSLMSERLLKNQMGAFFPTRVVRQECSLLPILFNVFLENIWEILHASISLGGRPMSSLYFTHDDILMAGTNCRLQDLTKRLTVPMHVRQRPALTKAKSWLTTVAVVKQWTSCFMQDLLVSSQDRPYSKPCQPVVPLDSTKKPA